MEEERPCHELRIMFLRRCAAHLQLELLLLLQLRWLLSAMARAAPPLRQQLNRVGSCCHFVVYPTPRRAIRLYVEAVNCSFVFSLVTFGLQAEANCGAGMLSSLFSSLVSFLFSTFFSAFGVAFALFCVAMYQYYTRYKPLLTRSDLHFSNVSHWVHKEMRPELLCSATEMAKMVREYKVHAPCIMCARAQLVLHLGLLASV